MIGKATSPDSAKLFGYRSAPNITWVRDTSQILLVDTEAGQFWSLCGTEAAVWSFLTLGYRYEEIGRFLSLILRIPEDEAKRTLITMLHHWRNKGIVQAMGDSQHG